MNFRPIYAFIIGILSFFIPEGPKFGCTQTCFNRLVILIIMGLVAAFIYYQLRFGGYEMK